MLSPPPPPPAPPPAPLPPPPSNDAESRFLASSNARSALLAQHSASRHSHLSSLRSTAEDGPAFLSNFAASLSSHVETIETLSSRFAADSPSGGATTAKDRSAVQSVLSSLRLSVKALRQKVASATLFLHPYDVRNCEARIDELFARADMTEERLVPRRRFTFKSRREGGGGGDGDDDSGASSSTTTTSAAASLSRSSTHHQSSGLSALSSSTTATTTTGDYVPFSSAADADDAADESSKAARRADADAPAVGYEDRADETIVWTGETAETTAETTTRTVGQGGEISADNDKSARLRSLTNCKVVLLSVFGAVRLQSLTNCDVYLGPVRGSVYVEACVSVNVFVACRQLRVHDSEDVTFFVHVASGPILESCKGLRFGTYAIEYKDKEEMMARAGIDVKSNNAYKDVKDFKWLRTTKSPNFDVVDVDDEEQDVEGPDDGPVSEVILTTGRAKKFRKHKKQKEEEEERRKRETNASSSSSSSCTSADDAAAAADGEDEEDEL